MTSSRVYPAPTVVVGLGRFGLATLEQLGDDWQGLRLSGSDASLDNLRLLWVHAAGDEIQPWRRREAPTVNIARYIDNSDMPSLVLDFVILRSLGLIRFFHGCYQVAMPQDRGVIDRGAGEVDSRRLVRFRYFEWLNLTPDPITSAERLKREAESRADLDLFVTPIISRVRQGHGPSTLLACIARCRALAQGRDPSPWTWLRECLASVEPDAGPEPVIIDERTIRGWLKRDEGYLETVAPEPLERWRTWLVWNWDRYESDQAKEPQSQRENEGGDESTSGETFGENRYWGTRKWKAFLKWLREHDASAGPDDDDPAERPTLDLRIPRNFRPLYGDPDSPLEPAELLQVDWQATGWATEEPDDDKSYYGRADVSNFRLGFFDHDKTERSAKGGDEFLAVRLQDLSRLLHHGLVRLWVDLQRERVEEDDMLPFGVKAREHVDDMLKQSLEVLGGLVVHPVIRRENLPESLDEAPLPDETVAVKRSEKRYALPGSTVDAEARKACGFGLPEELAELPREPSSRLRSLRLKQTDEDDSPSTLLDRRLADLGLEDARYAADERLLREVRLADRDLGELSAEGGSSDGEVVADAAGGMAVVAEGLIDEAPTPHRDEPEELLPTLRRTLNEEVRRLLGFSFLTRYRDRPTRQPPRLTVFVIGDLGEPFTRNCTRPVLRALHAELLRAFGPIFELNREGFDRALSIVPVLWMPHPSDPCDGASMERTRMEEAAIIEAVHGVRRWVESVLPRARRRVSQIFINGRVTDTAVLSCRDSIRQSRDFISLLCRNEIGREDWLRRTAIGPGGNDFFSSFACYEIEFPAERSREYLANRLARLCLERIKAKMGDESPSECREGPVESPEKVARASDEVREEIGSLTSEKARRIKDKVESHLQVTAETLSRTIRQRFGEPFGNALWTDVGRLWSELAESRGRMDDLVDQLRRVTSIELGSALEGIRRYSDREIENAAGTAGLNGALVCLGELRSKGREGLVDAESRRRDWETWCSRHRIPLRAAMDAARRRVVEAGHRKPDVLPMRVGAVLALLMAPVLGAPPLFALAQFFDLDQQQGFWRWLEVALGPAAPWTAIPLMMTLLVVAYRLHVKRAVRQVRDAIADLARAASRIVMGQGKTVAEAPEQPPSIRSFFEARLELTSALAVRRYATKVYEQTLRDCKLAHRLSRSIEIQLHLLRLRAERLGIRPAMEEGADHDDVRDLFGVYSGSTGHTLIPPECLIDYFERHVRAEEEGDRLPLGRFLQSTGGFHGWRHTACLADSERIMDFGREEFRSILERPITDQYYFTGEIGENLCLFVEKCFSNMGFGAKFLGYEGLDPDGVRLAANAALLLDAPLRKAFEEARGSGREDAGAARLTPALRPGRSPEDELEEFDSSQRRSGRPRRRTSAFIRTLDIEEHPVRPNAAYMFSLVQGIRAHSVRNLKRFESFHDRPEMPDDRTFPLSPDYGSSQVSRPIDHLMGCEGWARRLYSELRRGARNRSHDA